jgi:ubiquitin-protein ligase
MTVRIRRLQAEYERLKLVLEDFELIRIIEVSGRPPDRYVLEFRVKGLREEDDRIVERDTHQTEIVLGPAYPKEMPRCTMLTPVFHPNIDHLAICTEDIGSAGQTLDQTIVFIAEMISYQAYNLQSPRNGDAARWTKENQERLPIDNTTLVPPAWLRAMSEIEIAQAASSALTRLQMSTELAIAPPSDSMVAAPADTPDAWTTSFQTERHCKNCDSNGPLSSCANGHELCDNCRPECDNCHSKLCLLCPFNRCNVCKDLYCEDCIVGCAVCSDPVCLSDVATCTGCKKLVCNYHLDRGRCSSCAAVAATGSR